MLSWTSHQKIPFSILLTKADKLTRSAALAALTKIQKQCSAFPFYESPFSIELFSAVTGQGVDSIRQKLLTWLSLTLY
jgi:GTP-binding protein